MTSLPDATDVAVVGAGNAAFAAAHAAREAGCRVVVLERACEEEAGGNTRFTAGAMRFAYRGLDDLVALMPDLSPEEIAASDFGTYPEDTFFDDMARLSEHRSDPDLCELLVTKSRETLMWMRACGIRFTPIWGRQAFRVKGRFTFWGGLTVEVAGGGPGLLQAWRASAARRGIAIVHGARAERLAMEQGRCVGVVVRHEGRDKLLGAGAVVLACGGFQADPAWRARYLGPGWELAKVRGSRFSTGEGIRMALAAGAAACGNWSGCHAVAWERNAPEFGDLAIGDHFQKHSYPFGIVLNGRGERFVDEGADFRNYTYARYGRMILQQPGQFAWQVFDAKVAHLLRPEYRIRQVTKVVTDSLEALAARLEGVDAGRAMATIAAFNAAVGDDTPFNPNIKDGRRTQGLAVPKSNWANAIDTPPFEAYAVTCGITFTFGGLKIDRRARVLDRDFRPIPGLHAAGELVGGLFYFNYPGGAGLTAGAVFGRLAGTTAGRVARGGEQEA